MLADVPGKGRSPAMLGGVEPPLGAHLTAPRIGYVHHGIYVGDGKVIHYGAASRLLPWGAVEEVSLSSFSRGRPIAVRRAGSTRFDPPAVVARARSRLGEDSYRLLTNNCEHFAEWCLRGQRRSYQVERLLHWLKAPALLIDRTRAIEKQARSGWYRLPGAAQAHPYQVMHVRK